MTWSRTLQGFHQAPSLAEEGDFGWLHNEATHVSGGFPVLTSINLYCQDCLEPQDAFQAYARFSNPAHLGSRRLKLKVSNYVTPSTAFHPSSVQDALKQQHYGGDGQHSQEKYKTHAWLWRPGFACHQWHSCWVNKIQRKVHMVQAGHTSSDTISIQSAEISTPKS